jgi:hypothetical protein
VHDALAFFEVTLTVSLIPVQQKKQKKTKKKQKKKQKKTMIRH